MKKFNKKSLVLLVCAALLLTFTVSGTVAYLVDVDDPVVNEFKPATVDITTEDKVENGAKKDVFIKNSSTIPVYIRVAVVANWYKDGKIVAPWVEDEAFTSVIEDGWEKYGGYYYYTQAVQPDQTSVPFFNQLTDTTTDSYTPGTPPVTGAHLEMTIIAQAIQTEPADALAAANWAWSPVSTTN